MKRSALQTIWLPVFAAVGFFALTFPVWRWLWSEWMSNEYYSHGILILPVAIFLAVQRIRNDPRLNYGSGAGALLGLLLLIGAGAFYVFFLQNKAYYLASFAMIGILAGLLWVLGGTSFIRGLIFPVLFLTLMVPLPEIPPPFVSPTPPPPPQLTPVSAVF